jgi:class 3 adenylate cyclase/tetratricopeptide (TPR) repeat protein
MPTCAQCGEENPEHAKFCLNCAAPLRAEVSQRREVRKTVTVLFCDVTGSTRLGDQLDPESLRGVMARYFEAMKAVIERHRGTVEKFIGDAVMAVFGVPVLHEDDALRAVRAASEMRAALAELNRELAHDYGTQLELRIGVNTGEVVTGTEERLATGDVVNVAARLEQSAEPGESLLGEETLALVRHAVLSEPHEPLWLKGKAVPIRAHRLLGVLAEPVDRRFAAPMVGREGELSLLRGSFEHVVSERVCYLFTILGAAGVGKSRLATEFLATAERATVVRGRCLSYGEGITYWPVVEILMQLPRAAELGLDASAVDAVESLLRQRETTASTEEIAWAVRKVLEAVSAERPLICVLDDVHWGEPTFLDFVEHVAELSRDAPIFLLSMARPELLDVRPGWGGGKLNATTVLLEPLADEETDVLIASLADFDERLRAGIRKAAEGNPLFVEEMVALAGERRNSDLTVPPTIHALLSARLDQLDPAERSVLERGAVEGRVFHRDAVQALAPEESEVNARLTALVRKELIRPDTPLLRGQDAYRFRHLLIREAAYEALSKATRAHLHERLAAWLEEHGSELVELEEILGYHLEQAYRYQAELGPLDNGARAAAARAAGRLAAAGRRALGRGDSPAAANLLGRAATLRAQTDVQRIELLPDLAEALAEMGDYVRAEEVLADAVESAKRLGDRRLLGHARVGQLLQEVRTNPDLEAIREQASAAASVLEEEGDELGLARTWRLLAYIPYLQARAAETEEALERAVYHARRAGATREEAQNLVYLAEHGYHGTIPLAEGLRRCDELLSRVQSRWLAGALLWQRAIIETLLGRLRDAQETLAAAGRIYEDIGVGSWAAAEIDQGRGYLELKAGDPAVAEPLLRRAYEAFLEMGELLAANRIALELARSLLAQGNTRDAERLAREVGEWAPASDCVLQIGCRAIRALAESSRGHHQPAELLAREALTMADESDWLELRADTRVDLADVLSAAGRAGEAAALLEEAIGLYEQKGNVVSQRRARERLAHLSEPGPARA